MKLGDLRLSLNCTFSSSVQYKLKRDVVHKLLTGGSGGDILGYFRCRKGTL